MTNHLIIFDCDGTLVDSRHTIVEAMLSAFANCGLIAPAPSSILSTVGLSVPEAVHRLIPQENTHTIGTIGEAYKEAYFQLRKQSDFIEPFFDGAENTLKNMGDQEKYILGIATGKSRRGVNAILRKLPIGMEPFVTIQTADDAPSKPHPAMIEQAMADTGVVNEHTIMIGDTSFDMEMARNAGVKSIGVTWGYHSSDELVDAGAGSIVSNFDSLISVISSMTAARGEK